MNLDAVGGLLMAGHEMLRTADPQLHDVLLREQRRQQRNLSLVASSSIVDPSVLACMASVAVNVTAEGYPGRRYHAGCGVVDEIERLAIDRAKAAFGAQYVNVQPHSASSANYTVLSSLMRPGDVLLGMALEHGGHLSHGSPAAYSGQYFRSIGYGLTPSGGIDYEQVRRLAQQHRPRVIICGATAYPRRLDFGRFREIADEAGAYLMADISHTAGLVAAGLHPSPIDHAHITTTCTHKQLYGPRGGLIMCGKDHAAAAPRGRGTLADFLQRAIFPFSQGAPAINTIAAKARALARLTDPEFPALARRITGLAAGIAEHLVALEYPVITGGTDNHIVLVDTTHAGLTGAAAETALEQCGIIVNKNRLPGDTRPAEVTSGIRIGTNSAAWRGLDRPDAANCAQLIHTVLSASEGQGDRHAAVPAAVRDEVVGAVRTLCELFPVPLYPDRPLVPAGTT